MSEIKLDAQPRTLTGRKVRQLRRQGLVPVVVYGNKIEPVNLQITSRNLETALHHGAFSQLVSVDVEGGESHNVLVREIQRHPVTHAFVHVDLYSVNMSEKQHVNVPIVGVGTPEALEGGLMVMNGLDMVAIEAFPGDIPSSIEVDITGLSMDNPITVSDLPQIAGVEYLDDATENLFTMIAPRVEVIEEPVVEGDVEPELVGEEQEDEGEGQDESQEEETDEE